MLRCSASNALWRALLGATLLAPLASYSPAASTPRPIRRPYHWIAALPRQLRGGGADDVQMRDMGGGVWDVEPTIRREVEPAIRREMKWRLHGF